MKKDNEILIIIFLGAVIGSSIALLLVYAEQKINIGDFEMKKQQFEEVVNTMDSKQPLTICETEGEDCIILVTIKKPTLEQMQQMKQQNQENINDLEENRGVNNGQQIN